MIPCCQFFYRIAGVDGLIALENCSILAYSKSEAIIIFRLKEGSELKNIKNHHKSSLKIFDLNLE